MGAENAPFSFNKSFKQIGYNALPNNSNINIINLFDWIGTNSAENSKDDFYDKNLKLLQYLQSNSLTNYFYYGLGGGAMILNEYVRSNGFDCEEEVLIKISPRINGGPLTDKSHVINENS